MKLRLVRKERLELSRREALEPKSSASTNSATFALYASSLARRIIALRAYFSRFHAPRRLPAGCSARRELRSVVILQIGRASCRERV